MPSPVAANRATPRCSARAPHCGGLSCCGARAPGARASVVVARGLSSCGSWALEHRFSSCGTRVQLLRGMRDLPGPGREPVPPALAGGLPTTAPPGKPYIMVFHCGLNLYIPDDLMILTIFGIMSVQIFCPFKKNWIVFLLLSFESSYYFSVQVLYQICDLQTFPLSL